MKKYTECIAKNSGTGECGGKLNGRFCGKHCNQYRYGIIDKNGKKIRNFKKYTECIAKNTGAVKCSKIKKGRFCSKHQGQYERGIIDKNGNKLRLLSSEVKCKIKGCNNKHSHTNGSGLCSYHYQEIFVKGKLLEYEDSFTPVESSVKPNKKLKWHQF